MAIAVCGKISHQGRSHEPGVAFETGQKAARPFSGIMEIIAETIVRRTIRLSLVAALSSAGFMLTAKPAEAAVKCPAYDGSVQIFVKSDMGNVTYNRKLDIKAINRFAAKSGKISTAKGTRILGLTNYAHQIRYDTQTRVQKIRRNIYCAVATTVRLWVGFTELTVYLPRDYHPGSCQYKVIYHHENRHVAVSRQAMQRHLPKMRQRLNQLVRHLKPVAASSPKIASDRVLANLTKGMKSTNAAFERDLRRVNRKVDLDENGVVVRKKCKRW